MKTNVKKTLYMLIGPKGSGKTHIGSLVSANTNIVFLRVEPIWLSLQPGEDGWTKVIETLHGLFAQHDEVMIESLGAGDAFRDFDSRLAGQYVIKKIRVLTALDTCLERVRTRSALNHIPVSDDKVVEYNQVAARVVHDWAGEIDNNGPATTAEIMTAIEAVRSS
jgi:predicted ABC-type ATPase